MLTLKLIHELAFQSDVTFIRADPCRPILLVNSGYCTILALDIDDQLRQRQIGLSKLADEWLPYAWVVDQHGRCSLMLSSDRLDFGIGIDHDRWEAFRFSIPSDMPDLANICWTKPALRLIDHKGNMWTNGADGRLLRAPMAVQEEPANLAMSAIASRFAIFSRDAESGNLCLLDGASNEVGVANAATGFSFMQPGTGREIGASYFRGRLLVCLSECIDGFFEGRREQLLCPTAGQEFFGIDTGVWSGGSYLAVLSGFKNVQKRPSSFLQVYDMRIS